MYSVKKNYTVVRESFVIILVNVNISIKIIGIDVMYGTEREDVWLLIIVGFVKRNVVGSYTAQSSVINFIFISTISAILED